MKPAGFQAQGMVKIIEKRELAARVVVAGDIMAVSGMATRYPHPVSAAPEGLQDELGAHPARTRYAYYPYVRRIGHPAHSGQVRCPVTAPVTKKGYYLGLKFPTAFFIRHVSPF